MEEKMFNYLLAEVYATNKCIERIDSITNVLARQTKINKRQRFVNAVLCGLVVACVCNVVDLINAVKNQNVKIQALEAKLNGEGEEEQKGE